MYFNYYLSHVIVSDVSGFLIRRQNRPDILSAGEEVVNEQLLNLVTDKTRLLIVPAVDRSLIALHQRLKGKANFLETTYYYYFTKPQLCKKEAVR